MKAVILAGGFGTRLSEETANIPKPMVQIGDRPILWHIMKIYSYYGVNEFIILGGYRCYVIKEYFANYYLHQSDVMFDISNNSRQILNNNTENWKVTVLDTGLNTMTGGRIKRAQEFIGADTFFLTYGDGLSNVNLDNLLDFHKSHKGLVTMTAVQPEGRFGAIEIEKDNTVSNFLEKPRGDGNSINGGFFVCEPTIINYIKDDSTVWEKEPLESLAYDGKLFAFNHDGFWKPMDMLRDKIQLENLWNNNNAPWKLWK